MIWPISPFQHIILMHLRKITAPDTSHTIGPTFWIDKEMKDKSISDMKQVLFPTPNQTKSVLIGNGHHKKKYVSILYIMYAAHSSD